MQRLRSYLSVEASVAKALNDSHKQSLDGRAPSPNGWDLIGQEAFEEETLLQSRLVAIGCDEIIGWIRGRLHAAGEIVEVEFSKLPKASQLGELSQMAKVIQAADPLRSEVIKLENLTQILNSLEKALSGVAESLRRARQDVAKQTLDEISGTVAEYYEFIHPQDEEGEKTGAPKIEVQRHRSGTAFVRGTFAGRSVADPKWVYSMGTSTPLGYAYSWLSDDSGPIEVMTQD